jgi:hypothetical protein
MVSLYTALSGFLIHFFQKYFKFFFSFFESPGISRPGFFRRPGIPALFKGPGGIPPGARGKAG